MALSTRRSTFLAVLLPLLFVSCSAHDEKKQSRDLEVWSVCGATPFPDLCYKSTSILSPLVGDDFTMVVRGILGLSLDSSKAAKASLKSSAKVVGSATAGTCKKSMKNAVQVLGRAMKEVDRLGKPGSEQYGRSVETTATLANKAVVDANACLAALGQVDAGVQMSTEVKGTVMHTMQMCSIAVVFANSLAIKT